MKLHLPRIAIIAALGFSGAIHAADVGRVLLAAGDTVAIRGGQTIKLNFGSAIQDKDALRTGPASSLQVRFVDESIVSIKESSELRIDEFQFSGKEDGSERAFFRLVKGGLRTVTGLIGRVNNKNYQMTTTTATIGIRGTDYSATLCQGDCRNSDGSLARDGLYGRTHGISHGTNRIDVSNPADSKTFGVNENFYVASAKSLVERLLVSPDFVSGRLEGRKQSGTKSDTGGTGTEQATTGGAAGESRPSTTPEPLPQLTFVVTQELGPQGTPAVLLEPANGFALISPVGGAFFDADDLIGTYNSLNQLTAYSGVSAGSLNTGTITDTGGLTLANGQIITWGRWTGNTLVQAGTGGLVAGSPLLFVTASGVGNDQFLGGVATYTYAGGPNPVDAGGNVGSITTTSATMNFTTQTTTLAVAANFPSIVVSGSNTGPASFNVSGSGLRSIGTTGGDWVGSLSGTCTGSGCTGGASGAASGYFLAGTTGPNGYEFAVFDGSLGLTNAGSAVFLNAYLASSFTPGLPPASPSSNVGMVAYANNSPTRSGITSTGTMTTSAMTMIAYNSGSFSGTLGTGTHVEFGSILTIEGSGQSMNWGRWSGTGYSVTDTNGPLSDPSTGVPYVFGSSNAVLPTSGSFTYTYAGGPNPVNALGTVGTFGGGSFLVNFTTSTFAISTPLTLSVGGVNYTLNTCSAGCGISGVTLGGGSPTNFTGFCTGGACSTSTPISTAGAGGIFVGSQAGGLAVSGVIGGPAPAVAYAGAFKR